MYFLLCKKKIRGDPVELLPKFRKYVEFYNFLKYFDKLRWEYWKYVKKAEVQARWHAILQ